MWTKWKTIHRSFGLPRAAHACRSYLETRGVPVRLVGRRRGSLFVYILQVPEGQQALARQLLERCKQDLRENLDL